MGIIAGVERRRRWRDEDKLRVLAEAEQPGARMAEVARAPLAAEAVRRIDRVSEAERAVNGCPAADRLAHRRNAVAPLVADLQAWMRATRGKASAVQPAHPEPAAANPPSPAST